MSETQELSEEEAVKVAAFGLDKPEPNYHTVTVATEMEDEGTEDERRVVDRVSFACTAPPDADCRRYPDCGCESWVYDESGLRDEAGHERVQGQPCWLTDWFSNESAIYAADDYDDMRDDCVPAIDRSGPISVAFRDEWPEWEFVNELAKESN